MATIRKIFLFLLVLLIAFLAAVFSYNNPGNITIDVGFARFEDASVSLAFVIAFAIGWLFGLLSVGIAIVRITNERRRLRRNLKLAEAEVSSLRSLPLHDAN